MCKILCLTSHDPAKRDDIIRRVWEDMKTTERDGYGAAWFAADGTIGYYKTRWPVIPTEGVPDFVNPAFYDFNDVESDGGYLIIHGRAASPNTPINVHNTHPFISEDGKMALIHNGCVYSTMGRYKNIAPCTCDSQLLLLAYQEGGIDEVSKFIGGKFAFMALSLEDDKKTLHVAKDADKWLYGGKLPNGGYAIGTALHLLDVVGAVPVGEIKDHHILIFGRAAEGYELAAFEPYKVGYSHYTDDADTLDDETWQKLIAEGGFPKKPNPPYVPNFTSLTDDDEEVKRQERLPMGL